MNTARLQAIIDRIKAEPKCWDQQSYHCGTAHCIAGHAQIDMRGVHWASTAPYTLEWAFKTDPHMEGRAWLELTDDQAAYLFKSWRTLPEIEEFCRNGGLVPFQYNDPPRHG